MPLDTFWAKIYITGQKTSQCGRNGGYKPPPPSVCRALSWLVQQRCGAQQCCVRPLVWAAAVLLRCWASQRPVPDKYAFQSTDKQDCAIA